MYGKIINQILVCAPHPVRLGNTAYYNPSDETYRAAGYAPVIHTPCPDTESDVPWQSHWEERDGQILQIWSPAEA